jgi:RHS repeat-associated protein
VWLRGHIVLERNAAGAVNNRFFRCINGRLIQSEHHGFYLYNVRGDVVQRTNTQGIVLRVYRYSAFGVEIVSATNTANRFRYTGEFVFEGSSWISIAENDLPSRIRYTPTWIDPQFVLRVAAIQNDNVTIELTVTANENSSGQIFWRTSDAVFNEANSRRFEVRAGTHRYSVNLGRISMGHFRIDIGVEGSSVIVSDIALYTENDTNNNRFRFSGEYWDAHRGEIYLRARSFNPRTGRFTQPDPHWNINNMIFGDSRVMRNDRLVPSVRAIAQAGNLFIYCINNPVMWVDPSGKFVNLAAFAHWVRTGIRETATVAVAGTKESLIDGGGGIGVAGRIKIPHGQNIANQRAKTGTPRPTFNTTANTPATSTPTSAPAPGPHKGPIPPGPASSSTTARASTPQAQVQAAANASGGQLKVTTPQATNTGRAAAFNAAKRDAGIPTCQQPFTVSRTTMKDGTGRTIMNPSTGRPVETRQYHFTNMRGETVVVQDHGAGHPSFGIDSHFNVRPGNNLRTGSVPGTQAHYFFTQ